MNQLLQKKHRPVCERVYEESIEVIPSGVNSPVRAFSGLEMTPLVVQSGYGEKITDLDGNQYIDLCSSWGALMHGHAHPRIVGAAQKKIACGSSFGIATEIEMDVARKVRELRPSVEKVRFVSSGTEATMSAVRVARGFTGRDLVVKFVGHYHGHADGFLVQAGSGAIELGSSASSAGVPEDVARHTLCVPFNDEEAIRQVFEKRGEEIACVILEPVACNMGVVGPKEGYLELLRELTHGAGSLLIFDEVITGFRLPPFDVLPDLSCLGKVIGGGFPAAAFGGRAEVMDCLAPQGKVYQAGTLSGNPVAMAAGFEALCLCQIDGFHEEMERKCAKIVEPVKAMIAKRGLSACVAHVGSLFTIFFGVGEVNSFADVQRCDLNAFRAYFHFLFERGIYVPPSQYEANFISSVHSEESLEKIVQTMLEFFAQM